MLVEFGVAADGVTSQQVSIKGRHFSVGCREVPVHQQLEVPAGYVQIQCLGFSLNYRDQAVIDEVISRPAQQLCPVGSEYVGRIIATSKDETEFSAGQQVLFSYSYDGFRQGQRHRNGLLSEHCSARFSLVPRAVVKRLPEGMSLTQGAAFSVTSQTAYSMLRRSRVQAGDRALLYSTSSTSLALIRLLRQRGVIVYVVTSRVEYWQSQKLDVERWFDTTPKALAELNQFCRDFSGFDVVFDPFFDRNCLNAISFLKPFGRYLTCGIAVQSKLTNQPTPDFSQYELFILGLINNVEIIFNCLGTDGDLEQALVDFSAGLFSVDIDSVFSVSQESEFLQRSFSADKSGKVVFLYPEAF